MRLWARGNLRFPGSDEAAPEVYLNAALAAFGLEAEEQLQVEEEYFLWPENVAAINLWLSVQTQWYTDGGCRTGLNYPGVQICIDNMAAVPKRERAKYFHMLQAMERAALDEWSQGR